MPSKLLGYLLNNYALANFPCKQLEAKLFMRVWVIQSFYFAILIFYAIKFVNNSVIEGIGLLELE